MPRLLIALVFLAITASAQAQSLAPSEWFNQRGSIMRIDFWSPFDQRIGGFFINNAPNYPRCNGVPYALWGRSDGREITFTVNWSGIFVEDCKSTTVWTGRIRGQRLDTTWLLTRTNGQVIKGQDAFTRR